MSAPSPLPSGCLDEAGVQRLASGDASDATAAAHATSCPECTARVAEAEQDAVFLGRARGLLGDDLGPLGAPRLAGYRPLGVISTGGQGVVYRARQESTQRTVAIKVLAAAKEGTAAGEEGGTSGATRRRLRAEREVEIIARLKHPNIVAVHESRTIDGGGAGHPAGPGRVALVMEFVDGVPLDQWRPADSGVQNGDTTPTQVLRVFVQVCAGVHHAHLNGVIHRDLKPDNILVTPEGRPVVLDFGIAKINDLRGGLRTTTTGDFAGTPAYASPEQVAGKPDDVDALTDVYSLGVILYRLVCGRLPYDLGENIFEAARVIGSVQPAPPRSVTPAVSRDLEAVILRALSKEKSQRYQSAAALARDIERYLAGQPVEARSHSGWYLLRKAVSVNRSKLLPAAVAAGLVVAATLAVVVSIRKAAQSEALAQRRANEARAGQLRARSVSELLRAAIPQSDPRNPQTTPPVGRGMTRLYFRIETGAFASEPELESELRRLWGAAYTDLSGKAVAAVEYAEVSLRIGLVNARTANPGDTTETASFHHQLASVLLVRARPQEALVEARAAVAMRRRLSTDSPQPLAESLVLLGRAGLAADQPDESLNSAREAFALIVEAPTKNPPLEASARLLLATHHLRAGETAAAAQHIHAALTARLALYTVDDPECTGPLATLAALVTAAPDAPLSRTALSCWPDAPSILRDGDLLRQPTRRESPTPVRPGRTDALLRALSLQEALLPPDNPAIVGTLLLIAETAGTEARFDERADASLRAARLLRTRFGPHHSSVPVCLQDAAVSLAYAGRYERAIQLAREAVAFWQDVPSHAQDPLLSANGERYLLLFQAMAGDAPAALVQGPRASAAFTKAVGPNHHTVAFCDALTAWAALRTGDTQRALDLSANAIHVLQAIQNPPPDFAQHINMIRALVLSENSPDDPAIKIQTRDTLQRAWDLIFRDLTAVNTQRIECERALRAVGGRADPVP